jgi:hypothetical protein
MAEPAIPGSAQDDFDRLKMLFLRAAELDLTYPFSLACSRASKGHGWTVSVVAGKEQLEVTGPCVTEVVATMVRDLTRKLVLRWRSDGAVLQLCGVERVEHRVEATAFDPPEPVTYEARGDSVPDDRDPPIDRRRLPSAR